jgi:hypothetical protein
MDLMVCFAREWSDTSALEVLAFRVFVLVDLLGRLPG